MQTVIVRLSKMGAYMVQRLLRHDHRVAASNVDKVAVNEAADKGTVPTNKLEDIPSLTGTPRAVCVMVPSGAAINNVSDKLSCFLAPGDIKIDGGNSNYNDILEHAETLGSAGPRFVNVGISGSIWGLERECSMMVGKSSESLEENRELTNIKDCVDDSGEGRWTVISIDLDVPAQVITLALQKRLQSRQEESYSAKLLASMRNDFSGKNIKQSL